jgi:hypothetical protein
MYEGNPPCFHKMKVLIFQFALASLLSFMLSTIWTSATLAQLPLSNAASSPQSNAGVERLGDIEVAPIQLDGQTLFKVASPTVWNRGNSGNQIPVEVRSEQIEENLNRITGNKTIHLSLLHGIETGTAYDPNSRNVSLLSFLLSIGWQSLAHLVQITGNRFHCDKS